MTSRGEALDQLADVVRREAVSLFLGDFLGEGVDRMTFVFAMDETKVVKVENRNNGRFQNVREWHFWRDFELYKPIARWLAPCRWISHSGSVLIMDRTWPAQSSQLPDKVPSFLRDVKANNVGLLNGKIVAHDYGLIDAGATGTMVSCRLKKVDWGD